MAEVKIGNTLVGDGYPCFIIAEIGINHNGDMNIAKKLIDAAVAAGCNAVKFQKRTVDVVYTKDELARPRENPFGPTNGDLKRGLEFGCEQYREINAYCREKRIACSNSRNRDCWRPGTVQFGEISLCMADGSAPE
jgi:N-acetylneuraminate synthase